MVATGKGNNSYLSQQFTLQLHDPQESVTDQVWQEVVRNFAIEHEKNVTIAGTESANVLHYFKTGSSQGRPSAATATPFVSIRFAESVGLIQFELDDGETYTLVTD